MRRKGHSAGRGQGRPDYQHANRTTVRPDGTAVREIGRRQENWGQAGQNNRVRLKVDFRQTRDECQGQITGDQEGGLRYPDSAFDGRKDDDGSKQDEYQSQLMHAAALSVSSDIPTSEEIRRRWYRPDSQAKRKTRPREYSSTDRLATGRL